VTASIRRRRRGGVGLVAALERDAETPRELARQVHRDATRIAARRVALRTHDVADIDCRAQLAGGGEVLDGRGGDRAGQAARGLAAGGLREARERRGNEQRRGVEGLDMASLSTGLSAKTPLVNPKAQLTSVLQTGR
jgi:hypothetical protein